MKSNPVNSGLSVQDYARCDEHVSESIRFDPVLFVTLKVDSAISQQSDTVFCVHIDLKNTHVLFFWVNNLLITLTLISYLKLNLCLCYECYAHGTNGIHIWMLAFQENKL